MTFQELPPTSTASSTNINRKKSSKNQTESTRSQRHVIRRRYSHSGRQHGRPGGSSISNNSHHFMTYSSQFPFLSLWSLVLICLSLLQFRYFHYKFDDSSFLFSSRPSSSSLLLPTESQSRLANLSIEFFSSPRALDDSETGLRSKNALNSWLKLHPDIVVTLLGNESGYTETARKYYPRVKINSKIDRTFLGVPLFHSIFNIANQSDASVAVLINGDVHLYEDFLHSLRKVVTTFKHFLAIGARFDVDRLPPTNSDIHSIREYVWEKGTLHTYGGMDVWMWSTNGPRLFDPEMPSFVYGRGKYDNWFTHETINAGRRAVVDVTETVLAVHQRHEYLSSIPQSQQYGTDNSINSGIDDGTNVGSHDNTTIKADFFWSKNKKAKFETFINIYLSRSRGTYHNQMGSVLHAPWKFSSCAEASSLGICLIRRKRPGMCPCEYSSFVKNTQTDPIVPSHSRLIRCGLVSKESRHDYQIPVAKKPKSYGLPLTLRSVADRVAINGTVLLTGANYAYRYLLMNFICNVRRISASNSGLIIAAFDAELYRFAFVRGLPVFYARANNDTTTLIEPKDTEMTEEQVIYGSEMFKIMTKLKSRVVARMLRAGFNVIWCDVDVILFKNPLSIIHNDYFRKYPHVSMFIQSNAPDDEQSNARRRLNSGFYAVRSTSETIRAFDHIVAYAARSLMSEQPCFYDVLCGKNGENVRGDSQCVYNEENVVVETLDKAKFANGRTKNIWNVHQTGGVKSMKKMYPDLIILHNNWVQINEKRQRLKLHGLMFHDHRKDLCIYDDGSSGE